MLDATARYLGYPSSRKFLEEMVGYLFCQWLYQERGQMEDFPYQLLKMDSCVEFFK